MKKRKLLSNFGKIFLYGFLGTLVTFLVLIELNSIIIDNTEVMDYMVYSEHESVEKNIYSTKDMFLMSAALCSKGILF
jgi:hypothetical protein